MRVIRVYFWRLAFAVGFALLALSLLGLLFPRRMVVPLTHALSRPLPLHYWHHSWFECPRQKNPGAYSVTACATFPRITDIYFEAAFWQRVNTPDGRVYAYAAYWDGRYEPVVRLLVYSETAPIPRLYCQLWYLNDGRPYSVVANATYAWLSAEWEGPLNGMSEPYILTCPASPAAGRTWQPSDPRHTAPRAVSIVARPCQPASNAFAVQDAPLADPSLIPSEEHMMIPGHPRPVMPNTTSVAVCLNAFDSHDDVSPQLIEWLQFAKQFQVDKVYIYLINVHPNIRRVLDYYGHLGFVDVTELLHPPRAYSNPELSDVSNKGSQERFKMQQLRRQLLPYNDCLYRAIHKHHWIAAMDLNEMIVPIKDGTWARLIEREAQHERFDVLTFDRYFFVTRRYNEDGFDLTADEDKFLLPMLGQTWTLPVVGDRGLYETSLQSTASMLAMHNQPPLACVNECKIRYVQADYAKLHSYTSMYKDPCGDMQLSELACRQNLAAAKPDHTLAKIGNVAQEVENILNRIALKS